MIEINDLVEIPIQMLPMLRDVRITKTTRGVVVKITHRGIDGGNRCIVVSTERPICEVEMHPSHATFLEHNRADLLLTWADEARERKENQFNLDWIFSPLRRGAIGVVSQKLLVEMLRYAKRGLVLPAFTEDDLKRCEQSTRDEVNEIMKYVWVWDSDGFNAKLKQLMKQYEEGIAA